ncbi:MAG: glycosyltransferase family 4 protein [Candidatus Sumerlaeia bacterium]|nr:glycosyltransferase family 4 protein [Candidatus Sumerlaeia bacterium]
MTATGHPRVRPSVAFDITHVNDTRRTGIGRVVEECLHSILWLMENDQWKLGRLTLLSAWPFRLPGTLAQDLKRHGVTFRQLPLGSMYVYRATRLSWWVLCNRPDLLFVPEPIHPGLVGPGRLAVMHYDLITLRVPETASRHILALYRMFLGPTLRRAARVGVDSEFVRRETMELIPGFADKSEAVPIYVHKESQASPHPPEGIDPRAPFAFFIGNLMPHKNIDRLLRAFATWRKDDPEGFIPLYIVGKASSRTGTLARRLLHLQKRGVIRHFGYIDDHELEWFYTKATFLAFPSLIEGYGLPIMEAMSRGCPVLTSRDRATEETAGGNALLVNPESTRSILNGITKLAGNSTLRQKLAADGLAHAKSHTRQRHATALHGLLRRTLD